MKLSLRTDL